jgi:hypothetical protein
VLQSVSRLCVLDAWSCSLPACCGGMQSNLSPPVLECCLVVCDALGFALVQGFSLRSPAVCVWCSWQALLQPAAVLLSVSRLFVSGQLYWYPSQHLRVARTANQTLFTYGGCLLVLDASACYCTEGCSLRRLQPTHRWCFDAPCKHWCNRVQWSVSCCGFGSATLLCVSVPCRAAGV